MLSSLAQSGSRADPEGVKRAYFNSRAAAGMLTYINENFLHAPSTDLSREVVHLLIGVMTAQSTEIFTEKLVEEKKAPALVCRSANTAAGMYAALVEEMKEFQGKGIFDRNWLYILQIKAKLYASLAQYYRATADGAAGKHGNLLVRIRLADTLAQDAQRQANTFTYNFVATATPSLPSDAATCLQEICKAHATLCSEGKIQAGKDNDLIYHDILPSEASLPAIDKLPAAAPITIQEVYASPDVSKLIGPDIFSRLIPLAVHESASVYSEEKAKLVREEVERVDLSEGELRAGIEHLGLPGAVNNWRRLLDDESAESGEGDIELSGELRRLANEIRDGGNLGTMLRNMEGDRQRCEQALKELQESLDNESRECERMRVRLELYIVVTPLTFNRQNMRPHSLSRLRVSRPRPSVPPSRTIWALSQQLRHQTPKWRLCGKRTNLRSRCWPEEVMPCEPKHQLSQLENRRNRRLDKACSTWMRSTARTNRDWPTMREKTCAKRSKMCRTDWIASARSDGSATRCSRT